MAERHDHQVTEQPEMVAEESTPEQEQPEQVDPPEDTTEDDTEGTPEDTEDGDTFPRAYVEKLRREAADARVRAQKADDLAGALWAARVAATGRLADPTDLPMPEDADPLDPETVAAAVEDLLARKPHLASRVPRGDVGAGVVSESAPFSLGGMIRAAAR